MKQRLISAAVGLGILVVVLFLFDTIILNIAISILSLLAVYELLLATKYVKNKALTAVSVTFVAVVPFFGTPYFSTPVKLIILMTFILCLFLILLFRHQSIRIEHIGLVFMVSIILPFSFSSLIFIRDSFGKNGMFYALLAMGAAWLTDSGAYFIGKLFGKHKMAPNISPHKTVEGAIGGALTCILSFLLMGFLYQKILFNYDISISISYLTLALLGLTASVIGMLGDLSASIIKRQCSIKDFGSIMPGHGGVLDRFDSLLFTAPFVYLILKLFPIITG